MQEIINIESVTKKFNKTIALDNLSLTIKKGELFSLLGENGAGKSTLIKILSGLSVATFGTATIKGLDVKKDINIIKKFISICPQDSAVAVNLTVKENLVLIANLYGKSKVEAQEIAQNMINLFDLKEKENERVKKLSGGQKRRVSLALSLISEPEILFLDEPTLGLDVRSRRKLWDIINSIKGKTTILLTTHYMEEAEALSDRVAILEKGKLIALSSPQELKEQTNTDSLEQAFMKLVDGGNNL